METNNSLSFGNIQWVFNVYRHNISYGLNNCFLLYNLWLDQYGLVYTVHFSSYIELLESMDVLNNLDRSFPYFSRPETNRIRAIHRGSEQWGEIVYFWVYTSVGIQNLWETLIWHITRTHCQKVIGCCIFQLNTISLF